MIFLIKSFVKTKHIVAMIIVFLYIMLSVHLRNFRLSYFLSKYTVYPPSYIPPHYNVGA